MIIFEGKSAKPDAAPKEDAPAKENSLAFPFNQRWAMKFWNVAFLDQKRFKPNPHLSDVENRCALMVPHTAGGLLAHIRAKATVISEFYTQEGCLLEVQASPALLGRLLSEGARYAEMEDLPDGVKGVEIPDDEPPAQKPR